MLLAIDIGNTSTVIGVFDSDKLVFSSRIATNRQKIADQYAIELLSIFNLNSMPIESISGIIISSVVPELNNVYTGAIRKLTGKKPIFVCSGIKTGLEIQTYNPGQLGADMVSGAVGAIASYPLPCLVADLGTATKLYIINENKVFLGCIIAAGVEISISALSQRASLLTNIAIETPVSVVGKNSAECMQSGAVFGTAAMIDGLIDRLENELGCKMASVVATGGYSDEVIPNCRRKFIQDEHLILNGLRIIFNKNAKK